MYQWLRNTPLSGLSFPLTTASGTFAKGYNPAQLSGSISVDGGGWSALGSRISGIPGDGVYTIASLSGDTEMACYSWMVKITANSGCLDQCILGYNLSGPALVVDCSGNDKILTAVSGLRNDISGLCTLTNLSASQAQQNIDLSGFTRPVDVSGINDNINQLRTDTAVYASGNNKILVAISGLKNDVSGINGVLTAISSVPNAVASIDVTDSAVLISGTLAHTARLVRWFSWDNLVIDKTYTPNRLYLKDSATTISGYWELTDDSDVTKRTRGG